MIIFLILFFIVPSTTCSLHESNNSPNSFNLRKLLQETQLTNYTTASSNYTNASSNYTNTSTPIPAVGQRHPLAILHVVDDQGLVTDKVSTNQKIRLKVKALTTPDYQAPFVRKCWYNEYESQPSNGSEPSKKMVFLENGCSNKEDSLFGSEVVQFEENGLLEAHTPLFDLMPLYGDTFTFLDIRCEVNLCDSSADCFVVCTKKQKKWRMEKPTEIGDLSVVVEVKKVKPTVPPPVVQEDSRKDLNEFLISGGRGGGPPAPKLVSQTEAPFLKRNQHYFTVTTLGVVILLLLCLICLGFIFISNKNNKEYEETLRDQSVDYQTGYHSNKMTGLPNVIGTSRDHVTSPPPEYTHASAWPGADFNPRNPCVLTPSEAAVLEARRLIQNNQSPPRMQNNRVQRRLALENEPRGLYGCEAGRGQRNRPLSWSEVPENFREPANILTSPVGGEWYPVPSARIRSPQSEPLIQSSPMRGRDKPPNLIGMALKEYFNKYGM